MVAEVVIGALVGGSFAILGAFIAQRYQHVLDIRNQHRDDLVENGIRPWLAEVRFQASFVDPSGSGLSGYATGDWTSGYTFRRGHHGRFNEFDPGKPLSPALERHWPRAWHQWSALLVHAGRMDQQVEGLLEELRAYVGEPPDGVEWCNINEDNPGSSSYLAAGVIWENYWKARWQSKSRPEEVFRQMMEPRDLWRDKEAQRLLVERVAGPLFREEWSTKLGGVPSDCKELYEGWRRLEDALGVIEHDRNLAGKCDYCPRFVGRW